MRIFVENVNGSRGYSGGIGEKDSWKKPEAYNLVENLLLKEHSSEK